MTDLAQRLLTTTEQMASTCSVPMDLWDKHSNACTEAAARIAELEHQVATLEEGHDIGAQQLSEAQAKIAAFERKEDDHCGYRAFEVAELLDMLAASADRLTNSCSETASISRRGSSAIRYLGARLAEANATIARLQQDNILLGESSATMVQECARQREMKQIAEAELARLQEVVEQIAHRSCRMHQVCDCKRIGTCLESCQKRARNILAITAPLVAQAKAEERERCAMVMQTDGPLDDVVLGILGEKYGGGDYVRALVARRIFVACAETIRRGDTL